MTTPKDLIDEIWEEFDVLPEYWDDGEGVTISKNNTREFLAEALIKVVDSLPTGLFDSTPHKNDLLAAIRLKARRSPNGEGGAKMGKGKG